MRFDRCALCRDFLLPTKIIVLETSSEAGNGLSLEICTTCEGKMKKKANNNYLSLLTEEKLRINGNMTVADTPEKYYLELLLEEGLRDEE